MSQVAFRAAHHQQSAIEHLKYENDLLLRRNELLALENAKLLEELEQALKRIENSEMQTAERMVEEQHKLLERAIYDSTTLFHGMDRKLERLIGGEVAAYKESLSQDCPVEHLYHCLTQIISKLLEEKGEEREARLRDLISTTEGRLSKRRQARERTQQVVHLIREPPKELHS
jgi:flagellar biosynthesis GTPase FlhF